MLLKCCIQYASKFEKFSSGQRTVLMQIPQKGNAKGCSNSHMIVLISHESEVVLKILQTRLQQYMNRELRDVQAGFRKGRGWGHMYTYDSFMWRCDRKQQNSVKQLSFN